jgi:hypothetical protein
MGHDTVEIKTRRTPWLSHNPWWKDGFEFFDHTGGQGHVATQAEATPDQRADPLHHHPELIDRWGGECVFPGRRVPQGSQDLTWLPPESNALSST